LGTLQTLVAFVFVLGVLVFVHELGHFLAAKRVGIRVLKFQLGFNPTILSFRRGDTEYSIGALPLGGFVKMAGESPEDERTGSDDEFMSKTKWQRFQVLIMGPAMNLLLAVVLAAVVLYRDGEVPAFEGEPPVVGVVAPASPAERADIRVGDRILAVGGYSVERWDDFFMRVGARPEREVAIDLVRDGQAMTRRVTPAKATIGRSRFEFGDIGVLPNVHPFIAAVSPNEPGARGGLKPGDVILTANGKTLTFHQDFRVIIAQNANQPITLSILRDGSPLMLTVTPRKNGETGYLGITPQDQMKRLNPTVVEAIELSVQKNVQSAGLIFQTVWGLVTRETSPKQLMGPVAIAQLSGETAQLGWIALANLMAMISLNLGLLNLMPIPILDGGHIFIMALEGLARRNFSIQVKEKMLLAGFVVLMMLMVTVIYNDLTRISWIERLMPWR
jgi:regulator of sigma E protease